MKKINFFIRISGDSPLINYKIIDKINAYFGYKVLEKIKIVTFDRDETYNEEVISNESKKKFHSNIKNVKDESLKRSLSNLIKVFKSK